MTDYVRELLSKKCVLVPFTLACAFIVECYHQGINPDGGSFVFENKHIVAQYYYL